MAIKFKEIRKFLARNVRLSICFEDLHYDDYILPADIPEEKYDEMYVYGIGKIDVEFPKDVYCPPKEFPAFGGKDFDLLPALEIVLWDRPRDDVRERKNEDALQFGDLRGYLQVIGHMAIYMKEDWSKEAFEKRDDIPASYDGYYVYGIGMEEDPNADKRFFERAYDNSYRKRIVIVLAKEPV